MVSRQRRFAFFCSALVACGCSSTGGQLGTLQTQNRSLLEQNRAQVAEMENLKAHARRLEDKLLETERQLEARQRDSGRPRVAANGQGSTSIFDRSNVEDHDAKSTADIGEDRRR